MGVFGPSRKTAAKSSLSSGPDTCNQSAVSKIDNSLSKIFEVVASIENEGKQTLFLADAEKIKAKAATDINRAKADLLVLQTAVNKELKSQKAFHAVREEATALLLEIAHIETEYVTSIKKRIETVSTTAEIKTLKGEAKKMIESHRHKEDAEYVAASLVEILDGLGLGTGNNETYIQNGTSGFYAYSAKTKHNAIKVQINADKGTIDTRVVALDETGAANAEAAERALCPDIFEAFDRLKTRGIESNWLYHQRPGSVEMEQYFDTKIEKGKAKPIEGKRASIQRKEKTLQ